MQGLFTEHLLCERLAQNGGKEGKTVDDSLVVSVKGGAQGPH